MPEWSSPETADAVLAYMQERADPEGVVAVSFRALGDALHLGRSTASNAMRRLVDTGRIRLVRMGTGHRYPSRYLVRDVDCEPTGQFELAG